MFMAVQFALMTFLPPLAATPPCPPPQRQTQETIKESHYLSVRSG